MDTCYRHGSSFMLMVDIFSFWLYILLLATLTSAGICWGLA